MAYLPVHKSRSVRDERGSGENEGKLLTGQSFFPPGNAVSACSGYLCYWFFGICLSDAFWEVSCALLIFSLVFFFFFFFFLFFLGHIWACICWFCG